MNSGPLGSLNDVADEKIVRDAGKVGVLENEIERLLMIVDGVLDALSPPVGTAREFTDRQRQLRSS